MRHGKRTIFISAVISVFMVFAMAGNALAKSAEMAYVEWACATATANVAKAALASEMDYTVDLTPVGAAAMWQALSSGDVDFITTAWLPITHGHYMDRVGDNVDDMGPALEGARIGLVVPTYVDIDSMEEMNAHADKFNGEITGIDPGAGIMSRTEQAIEDYGMDNMDLMESSDAMMTAVLGDKVSRGEWVVVTGWTPHWKFGQWDLKYLEDPKGVFGAEETINKVARMGLEEDMPDLYAFLENFYMEMADLQTVMAWAEDTGDPEGAAKRWVEENPDKVAAWIP